MAQAYWDQRKAFRFGMPTGTVAQCIAQAMACETHPVILADSGDNPTGGGVGDRADMLAALIEANAQGVVFAGITDRPATDRCYFAGVGARLNLRVGATLDPSSPVVQLDAQVVFLLPVPDPVLREAVVAVAGITLVLTAKRRPFHLIADFQRLQLNPAAARILVVKSGYLSPDLAPLANPALMALSAGVVDQFVERLPRLRMTRPTFPFVQDFEWTPVVYGTNGEVAVNAIQT